MDGTPPVLLNVIKIIFFKVSFFKRFLPKILIFGIISTFY